jgi:hypothetical protein
MKPLLDKYLPLEANSSSSTKLFAERQKDHYSHFILRLAFASTEDLRRRFARVETMLFRLRFGADDTRERIAFVQTLNLDWEPVSDEERREFAAELAATSAYGKKMQPEEEGWCKVDWDRVPDLVEGRRVFVKAGKAYVPAREQQSMVVAEFTARLEKALEVRRASFYFYFYFILIFFFLGVTYHHFPERFTDANLPPSSRLAPFLVWTKTTALPLSWTTSLKISSPRTPATRAATLRRPGRR